MNSLAQTLEREEYHFQRHCSFRRTLDELRDWAPGDIFFSTTAYGMHYETQALAGAARAIVDQLLFLILLRYDSSPGNRKEKRWKAATNFDQEVIPGSEVDVPEVRRLRCYQSWFDLLNSYRNQFFHAAWQHGSGHYHDGRLAAELPRMNSLLVPDKDSLSGRSRPWDWTWKDRTTVDDIAKAIHDGLVAMLNDICENEWHTSVPSEGSVPADDHPDLIIDLPSPVVIHVKGVAFIPFFSSRDRASLFIRHLPDTFTAENELIEIKSNNFVFGKEAVAFSLARQNLGTAPTIHVWLDPEPVNTNWSQVHAREATEVDAAILAAEPIQAMGMPVDQPMTVFAWHTPMLLT